GDGRDAPGSRVDGEAVEIAATVTAIGEVFPGEGVDGGAQDRTAGKGGEEGPAVRRSIETFEPIGAISGVTIKGPTQVAEPPPGIEAQGRSGKRRGGMGRRIEADESASVDQIEVACPVAGNVPGPEPEGLVPSRPGVGRDVIDSQGGSEAGVGGVDLPVEQGSTAIVPGG